MRKSLRDCRGFTLIELIASITIIAILAAVAVPNMPVALPYAERGYADAVTAALRQSRAVALATGCAVQFTIDVAGFRAFQRGNSVVPVSNHCATAGPFVTPVRVESGLLDAAQPAEVVLAANRQFVFDSEGDLVGGAVSIDIGPQSISVDTGGLVQGP